MKKTTGILLQGDIRNWTIPIIEEYQKNFPDSEIMLSTWNNEDVSNIPCKVIKNNVPEPTHPYKSSKNYQIIGSRGGLNAMNSDIILKTRTDMFVHNPYIFKIFLEEEAEEKIMYPYSGFIKESQDYAVADYCQLSSRKTLLTYWNLMPLHDGSTNEPVEKYLTRNYILKILHDERPWNLIHNQYFIRKRYHEDFQIESARFIYSEPHQQALIAASSDDNRLFTLLDTKNEIK